MTLHFPLQIIMQGSCLQPYKHDYNNQDYFTTNHSSMLVLGSGRSTAIAEEKRYFATLAESVLVEKSHK